MFQSEDFMQWYRSLRTGGMEEVDQVGYGESYTDAERFEVHIHRRKVLSRG